MRIEVQSGVVDLDAVSVVPEPSTWALIAGGMALIGVYLRSNVRRLAWAVCLFGLLAAVSTARAATFTENFSTNPLRNGWHVFGPTNLFQWNPVSQNLDVTWDSTLGNNYFYHSLGTILTRNDDFALAFDLQVNEAEATGYGFELSVGLFNLAEATNSDFNRSTGENSPNLVEFDYFPDVGYGPTIWPLFVDTNSLFNYNGSSDYAIYGPIIGDWYHIVMTYSAAGQTMVTTMTNYEGTSGITVIDPLDSSFTDFRVDTLSVSSYQDDGFGDSVYAQGVIDNFAVTLPPPPVQDLVGSLANGRWLAQFTSQDDWLYTLQRTADFQTWTNVSAQTTGNGTTLYLFDNNPLPNQAFYRVSATRP